MNRDVEEILDTALDAMRQLRVGGEIYLEDHAVFSVVVSGGAIESLETQEVRGAGLRLFEAGRMSFACTADVSADGLREAAGMAKGLLPRSDPDEHNVLPEPDESPTPEPEIHDALLVRIDPQEKLRAARRLEQAARAADPRVTRVRQARYTDVAGRVAIANTGGLRRLWPFSRAYASIEVTAEDHGEMQSGWHADFSVRFSGIDPVAVGAEAARRAVAKLGARPATSRRAHLVLDPVVAASFLEAIGPALHADNVLKGKSLLASRLDRQVGSRKVTLLDDGRAPGGDHSAPYDAEGVATRCTMLVEGGVLKGYLHSSGTSLRMSAATTGNMFRASWKSPPHIGPSNLYLQPTGVSRETLLAEAGDGFHIMEVMGLHTIDPISGDFSLGAAGSALRGGHAAEPVDRIVIAGNILGLLSSVGGVGTDLRFMPGGGAGSSTLLTDISVSGT